MRATSFLLFLALGLAGCPGGSETTEATPAPESTPEAVVEATPEAAATDDDDSAGAAKADDDDSAATAAGADVAAAVEAPAEGETGDEAADAAVEPTTPDEPPPPPREEGVEPPYDVTLIGVARDGDTGGVFSVSVRGEVDIIKDIKWTVPAGFKGPKKTTTEADSTYVWTLSGLGKGEVKGTVLAKLDKWTRTVEYQLPPLDEAPPPSPQEDPAPAAAPE